MAPAAPHRGGEGFIYVALGCMVTPALPVFGVSPASACRLPRRVECASWVVVVALCLFFACAHLYEISTPLTRGC